MAGREGPLGQQSALATMLAPALMGMHLLTSLVCSDLVAHDAVAVVERWWRLIAGGFTRQSCLRRDFGCRPEFTIKHNPATLGHVLPVPLVLLQWLMLPQEALS